MYLRTRVRVGLDRAVSPFSNLTTRTNFCKDRFRPMSGLCLKGLPFPVVVSVILPLGLNYVHIQIQSGECRSELGMPALYQHRVNPIHPLRSTAPRLSVRGNSSERRTALGRGRSCDSWHRPAAGPVQCQIPESASHPTILSPSILATAQKPPLPRPHPLSSSGQPWCLCITHPVMPLQQQSRGQQVGQYAAPSNVPAIEGGKVLIAKQLPPQRGESAIKAVSVYQS